MDFLLLKMILKSLFLMILTGIFRNLYTGFILSEYTFVKTIEISKLINYGLLLSINLNMNFPLILKCLI